MSGTWCDGIGVPLGFTLVLGVVVGQTVQDEDLAPLSALVQGCQQLVDVLRVQVQQVAVGVGLADLRQGSHRVGYDLQGRQRVLFSCPFRTGATQADQMWET